MKILITGGSGLIGRDLTHHLQAKYPHYQICVLTRDKSQTEFTDKTKIYQWDPYKHEIEEQALVDLDILIHLAGESVAQLRWSKETKDKILNSRVIPTKFLKDRLNEIDSKAKFISASAIGIYGDRADEVLDSSSKLESSFLADVCKRWENEIFRIHRENSYAVRIGIVLASNGGALEKMIPPFKLNLGGILGNGKQFMSWIHIDDLVGIFDFLIHNSVEQKILNGVSPNPVRNEEFTKTLAKALKKKIFFRVPKFFIEKALGEMSQIVLTSQRVHPKDLISNNFEFKFPYLNNALDDIIASEDY